MLPVCGGSVTAVNTALSGVTALWQQYMSSAGMVVVCFCSGADTVYWLCWWYCSASVCAGYVVVCHSKYQW